MYKYLINKVPIITDDDKLVDCHLNSILKKLNKNLFYEIVHLSPDKSIGKSEESYYTGRLVARYWSERLHKASSHSSAGNSIVWQELIVGADCGYRLPASWRRKTISIKN